MVEDKEQKKKKPYYVHLERRFVRSGLFFVYGCLTCHIALFLCFVFVGGFSLVFCLYIPFDFFLTLGMAWFYF